MESWVWLLVAAGIGILALNFIDVSGILGVQARQGYVGNQMGGWRPIETATQRF